MIQQLIVGVIVALAAAWVVWSILLPRKMKQAVRARFKRS